MYRKTVVAVVLEFVLIGLLLFLPAGTIAWTQAWVFLILLFVLAMVITRMLVETHPDLLGERVSPIQRGQKGWDKILVPFFVILFLIWLPLMAFDAVRLTWSEMPRWLNFFGGFGVLLFGYIMYATFRENPFLSRTVRIQEERGQHVISTGPYRVVRHPLYTAAILLLVSSPLLLGSWIGLIVSGLLVLLFIIRTMLEDRTLQEELDGYTEYTSRVPYRLVPYIW